jgi:hypothetical protein
MIDSVADLVQVIAHEREGRDRGWWSQMAGCYHPDSRVRSMWFTGSGEEFAAASRGMAASGDRSRHRLSVPSVHRHGQRAVVSMPMAIEFRVELHGVEADLVSYARGIYRLEWRDGRIGICDLSTIYERDTLNPPAFDAHLHSWEGAFRGEQVRPGNAGQGCPSGAGAP